MATSYKPLRRSVTLCLDPELLERRADAYLRHAGSIEPGLDPSGDPALSAEIAEIEQEIASASVTFTARAIGRKMVRVLASEAPPNERDQKENKAWNEEKFCPLFCNAMFVEPKKTLAEWVEIWDEWPEGPLQLLFDLAWSVNHERGVSPTIAAGIEPMRSGGES